MIYQPSDLSREASVLKAEGSSLTAGRERKCVQDFRNLEVWKKAHRLVLATYEATQKLPREEVFGITMQLRRTAAGVPMRIAAASSRDNQGEKAADLNRAIAGASELEYPATGR